MNISPNDKSQISKKGHSSFFSINTPLKTLLSFLILLCLCISAQAGKLVFVQQAEGVITIIDEDDDQRKKHKLIVNKNISHAKIINSTLNILTEHVFYKIDLKEYKTTDNKTIYLNFLKKNISRLRNERTRKTLLDRRVECFIYKKPLTAIALQNSFLISSNEKFRFYDSSNNKVTPFEKCAAMNIFCVHSSSPYFAWQPNSDTDVMQVGKLPTSKQNKISKVCKIDDVFHLDMIRENYIFLEHNKSKRLFAVNLDFITGENITIDMPYIERELNKNQEKEEEEQTEETDLSKGGVCPIVLELSCLPDAVHNGVFYNFNTGFDKKIERFFPTTSKTQIFNVNMKNSEFKSRPSYEIFDNNLWFYGQAYGKCGYYV